MPDTAPSEHSWSRVLTTIGSPLAAVTALLFYFGWARSSVQASRLGYDISIAGYTTTDYVVRSINLVFVTVVGLALLSMVALPAHDRLVRHTQSWDIARRRRLTAGVLMAGWICLLLGVAGLLVGPRQVRLMALPAALTLWLLCRIYARALSDHLKIARSDQNLPRRMLSWILLGALLFWDAERLALLVGEGYAAAIAADPTRLPAIVVVSEKDLGLAAPGVTMRRTTAPNAAYSYRFQGLRLLQRTEGRYVAMNEQWNERTGRIFLLTESPGVRFEFHREPS